MTVWLYSIVRNEAKFLPYFLRAYEPWVDRLIFYDDQSDDGTREIIAAHPKAELRDWTGTPGINDDEFMHFANRQWKEARGHADWVVWVDADEILYHPDILGLLAQYQKAGVEVPLVAGYTMVSDRFPTTDGQIYDEIKSGIPSIEWSKQCIFRGNIHWNVGRHSLNLSQFKPVFSEWADIKLLHYRCLGMEYLKWRHERNWSRVPDRCKALNYGRNCDPEHKGDFGVEWFEKLNPMCLGKVI